MYMETSKKNQRWKVVLGGQSDSQNQYKLDTGGKKGEGRGSQNEGQNEGDYQGMCDALDDLYEEKNRKGGLGGSSPKVSRWLGDIRKYFPSSVVSVMQKDAIDRYGIEKFLQEPEFLEEAEVNIEMITTIMSLQRMLPEKTRETARNVIRKMVKKIEEKLVNPTKQAIKGALNKNIRNHRPSFKEIDWSKTIRANLKHYQHTYNTIIPERIIGNGRKGSALKKNVILCIDQSGSMGSSVVYSGIFGAVLASIPALQTQLVVFDTSVVDLTENMQDPVDVLFGVQLGGGTDINKALAYCQKGITRPSETVLVLITDLYEGGDERQMLRRVAEIKQSGVNIVTLLALNDEGAPYYDHRNANAFAEMGIPCFACTPDKFPSLTAAALQKLDIWTWMDHEGIVLKA